MEKTPEEVGTFLHTLRNMLAPIKNNAELIALQGGVKFQKELDAIDAACNEVLQAVSEFVGKSS